MAFSGTNFSHGAGLFNNSQTCYMNSIIVLLFHIVPFCSFLGTIDVPLHRRPSSLIFSLQRTAEEYYSSSRKSSFINPVAFIAKFRLRNRRFIVNQQHDAQEAFVTVLDSLDEELLSVDFVRSNPLLHGSFSSFFLGNYAEQKSCSICYTLSSNNQPFHSLELPIPKSSHTVEDVFYNFLGSEVRDRYCSYCGSVDNNPTEIKMVSVPTYLILSLKLFEFDFIHDFMRY
jgi:ubiquitin C-terminal hydrolase